MSDDYRHKIGGQRWLAERLGMERKKVAALERIADALERQVAALERIADALERHTDLSQPAVPPSEKELRTRPETKHTEETQEGR